jgi:hypothetical protein
MKFVHLYLVGYLILVFGAGLALWQAGVLAHISTIWILISVIILIGLGVLMAATATNSTTITRD